MLPSLPPPSLPIMLSCRFSASHPSCPLAADHDHHNEARDDDNGSDDDNGDATIASTIAPSSIASSMATLATSQAPRRGMRRLTVGQGREQLPVLTAAQPRNPRGPGGSRLRHDASDFVITTPGCCLPFGSGGVAAEASKITC